MIYTDPCEIYLELKDDLYVKLFLFLERKWTQYFEIVQNCGPLLYHFKKKLAKYQLNNSKNTIKTEFYIKTYYYC